MALIKHLSAESNAFTGTADSFDSESVGGSPAGSVGVTSTSPLKGSFSFQITDGLDRAGREDFTAVSTLFVSLYVRFPSFPSATQRFVRITDSLGATITGLNISSTGVLNFSAGVSGTTTLSTNTTYRIGIEYTTAGVLRGYVATGDNAFGSPFASTTTSGLSAQPGRVFVGATNANVGANVTFTFDDGKLDDAVMPDPSTTTSSDPYGSGWDGDVSNITAGNGALGWYFDEYTLHAVTGTNNLQFFGPFHLSEGGTLQRAKVLAQGGTNAQAIRVALYTNSTAGGMDSPADPVAITDALTINVDTAKAFRTLTLPTLVAVDADDYWLAVWFANVSNGCTLWGDDKIKSRFTASRSYSSTGDPPSVAFTTDPFRACPSVFWEYTVAPQASTPSGYTALTTTALPVSTLVVNPLNGPYRWRGQEHLTFTTDGGIQTLERYDRFTHRQLETSLNSWNMTPIQNLVNGAAAVGQLAGVCLRWMVNPSSDTVHVPDYIANNPGTYGGWYRTDGTFVPDWNNANFIARMRALIAKVGETFAGQLAFIDLGGPGQFGEWAYGNIYSDANKGSKEPMKTENGQQIFEAYIAAFPNTRKVLHLASTTISDYATLNYPQVGLRPQVLGDIDAYGNQTWGSSGRDRFDRYRLYRLWQTAAQIGETRKFQEEGLNYSIDRGWKEAYKSNIAGRISALGNGNWTPTNATTAELNLARQFYLKLGYRLRLAQLDVPTTILQDEPQAWTSYWLNSNVNIPHVAYQVRFELRSAGVTVWTGRSTIRMSDLTPTGLNPYTHTDNFTVRGLPTGSYDLYVRIPDTSGKYRAMRLDHAAGLNTADNSYLLGAVAVGVSVPIDPGEPKPVNPPLPDIPELVTSQGTYKLVLRTPTGVKTAEVGDILTLEVHIGVNESGACRFTLPANHVAVNAIARETQVEVWRQQPQHGIGWTREFSGYVESWEQRTEETDVLIVTAIGDLGRLGWRSVGYAAGTANRSRFESEDAETIMRTLVEYNAGPSATVVNGRKRTGTITGLSSGASAGQGNVISWNSFGKNLLTTLQDMARVAGGDFDLLKNAAGTAWTFQFYPGQRGSDRTATVTFALEAANMADPVLRVDHTKSATAAIVAGSGTGATRTFVTRTSSLYSATYDRETFVDHRASGGAASTVELDTTGDVRLEELAPVVSIDFRVLQTPASLYRKHYQLGDLVTARYAGQTVTKKVLSIALKLERDGKETIEVGLESYTPGLVGRIVREIADLSRRVAGLETQE